jgi:hypothetical protein
MRRSRSLAGTWQFQLDPDGSLTADILTPDREIPVPMPWQAAFPELREYSGFAWYRCSLDLDAGWLGGELLLHFGAVDYWCQVFVNGKLAGEHEGGYTPVELPIRRLAHEGENEIAVRVYDVAQTGVSIPRWPSPVPTDSPASPPFDANDIPHGKQEWYINVGGIWQDVSLAAVPTTYISQCHVATDIRTGQASFLIEIAGSSTDAAGVMVRVDDGGIRTAEAAAQRTGQEIYNAIVLVEQPHLWSVEDPHLYTATVTLQHSGSTQDDGDEIVLRFGFREIATRDGELLLNGAPIFLLSALDQDLYPDTIYTVPSEEYLRDEFEKAKHLGLNSLRCHIKPPDPLYLDLADEMGLLIWEEIPSWRTFHEKGTLFPSQTYLGDNIKRRVQQTLDEMIRRDFNHPSLIAWTIVNEDWGTALPLSASDRQWVAQMYEHCKRLDPTRLVVDNSACLHQWGPNIHVQSDLDDFHIYANIPDQAWEFEQQIEQFNLRPLWTFSSHGDSQRSGQEPLVLSEFGNWGMPSLDRLREHYGGDPPWFDLGPWWSLWGGEPGWPMGVEERFKRLGLESVWADYETFARATQWHQFAALKFEIETIRRQPSLKGYVITELTDAYWESNGLLDFLSNPKEYYEHFSAINTPDIIIPRVSRYDYWDDEEVDVSMHAARYSGSDWRAARLRWGIAGQDPTAEIEIPKLKRGETRLLGSYTMPLPRVERAQKAHFELALEGEDGKLASNTLDLLVLPAGARRATYQEPLALTMNGTSSSNLGYRTTPQITPDTRLAVTDSPDAETLRWVHEGGDLLFISRGPSPFYWVQRRGGIYGGGWITSFSWLRPGIHRRLGADNPLGLPFRQVIPQGTILGLPVEDPVVQGDFLAGMVSGWVRHPAVHTVQFRYGRGRVIMTTFALHQALHGDSVATAMLHDLVDYLASDACQPMLTANLE